MRRILLLTVAAITSALLGMGGHGASAAPTQYLPGDLVDPAVQFSMAKYTIDRPEAERRLLLQEAAGAFEAFALAGHSQSFAGLWLDQDRGRVVLAIKGEDTALEQAADERGLGPVEVRRVDRSWAHLRQLQVSLRGVHMRGISTSISTSANKVIIDSPRDLPAEVKAVVTREPEAYLIDNQQLPDISPQACSFPYCDAPLRAGIGLRPGGGRDCTNAFNVRSKSDGKYYATTAGHCVDAYPGVEWQTYFAFGGTHGIGPRQNDAFPGVDAAIIAMTNPAGWSPGPAVVVWPGNGFSQNENYVVSGSAVAPLSATVCVSGSFSGSKCGVVENLSTDTSYGANDVVTVRMDGKCTTGGDSGAPWWANGKAYGIHSGGSDPAASQCVSVYTRIDTAMANLNVRLITTSAP